MCEITEGYTEVCDAPGGVAVVYAANKADIDTMTVVNGEVTVLTMKAGKQLYAFNVEMETATFTDTATGERANKSFGSEQSMTVVLHGNTKENVVELENMAKGRTVWFPKLNDDSCEVLFRENGAKVSYARTPGTAYEDMNGNTLTITGKEKHKAPKIALSLITAALTPAS